MQDNIFKCWGTRKRILKNDLVEIDHLFIKKDYCCSVHNHKYKSNRFYIISGECKIKTELGEVILKSGEYFDVHPPITHQFIALSDVIMVECAYLQINEADINRKKQGGKIIDGKHITQDEMKEKGLLDL